jgi:hypothetical protein
MSRRRASLAVLAMLLAGIAGAAPYGDTRGAETGDWTWSIAAAPGVFSPRMHAFDGALHSTGIGLLNSAYAEAISNQASGYTVLAGPYAEGFAKTGYGFSGQGELQYEFDEDLRGGIQLGVAGLDGSGNAPLHARSHSGTTYRDDDFITTYKISIPIIKVGISLQKVFRYEEMPRLNLYIGGWGGYTIMMNARFSGTVRPTGTDRVTSCSADLNGSTWHAGGLGGIEYQVARWGKFYAETGFEQNRFDSVEQSNAAVSLTAQPAGSMYNGKGGVIPIDLSGIFIRAGFKTGLGN